MGLVSPHVVCSKGGVGSCGGSGEITHVLLLPLKWRLWQSVPASNKPIAETERDLDVCFSLILVDVVFYIR